VVISPMPEIRVLARVTSAWSTLITRDRADEARVVAREAAALADEHGYGQLEMLALACEATAGFVAESAATEIAETATRLATLAREREAPPLAAEGELLALLAAPEGFDPARVEAIAALETRAPAASRRARALLGEAVTLDRVDEAIVRAARRRLGVRVVSVGGHPLQRAGAWGLDERSRTVWLEGRICSLADRPLLWRILAVIADAGGSADKESLVVGAWGQRDYHPLRDDARLHTAIRALRRLIEDDPARPSRLITTEEGYAFGRDARVRRVVTA
jgi:hypothetical protein